MCPQENTDFKYVQVCGSVPINITCYLIQVNLSLEDIETILDTIVYDGKVEKYITVDLGKNYRAVEPLLPPPGFVRIPCGVCPVINYY